MIFSFTIKVNKISTSFVINYMFLYCTIGIFNSDTFEIISFSELSFVDCVANSLFNIVAFLNGEYSRNLLVLNIFLKRTQQLGYIVTLSFMLRGFNCFAFLSLNIFAFFPMHSAANLFLIILTLL